MIQRIRSHLDSLLLLPQRIPQDKSIYYHILGLIVALISLRLILIPILGSHGSYVVLQDFVYFVLFICLSLLGFIIILYLELARLREDNEQWRSLLAQYPQAFCIYETTMVDHEVRIRFIETNPAFEDLVDIKAGQEKVVLNGADFFEALVRLAADVSNRSQNGNPFAIEYFDRNQLQTYNVTAFRAKPRQVAVVFNNITQFKQVDEDLRKLSSAVIHSPASVVITDIDGKIEYINPKFTELTGYTLDEARGKNPRILKTDITPRQVHVDMWKSILSGQSWQGEFCNQKKDGSLYWESASISPILDDQGQITHFVAVKVDVTLEKHLQAALQSERDNAVQVMDKMGQGLMVTGPEGCFEYVNPAFGNLMKVKPKKLLGKHPSDFLVIKDHVELNRDQSIKEKSTYTYEADLQKSDGSVIPVLVTEVPRWRGGHYSGGISVITDLTSQKQVQEDLRKQGSVDILTGLSNRSFFEGELSKIQSTKENPTSIILADIDNLKMVNDNSGHQTGDLLLKRAAQVLKSVTRTTDCVARIGGDEFALILVGAEESQAQQVVKRIRNAIEDQNYDHPELTLSLSIGSATAYYGNLIDTVREADSAMYEDKRLYKRVAHH